MLSNRLFLVAFLAVLSWGIPAKPADVAKATKKKTTAKLVRSARSGPWSTPATWEGGRVPAGGDKVQVRTGHTVLYDVRSDQVIRSLHITGTLTFAHNRDTRLEVGLIKVQPSDSTEEDGLDCESHLPAPDRSRTPPALLVGSPERPIDARPTALIRLHYVEGMDRQSCPAIVCCGGRMEFHGAPMNRTWTKFGATARKGDAGVTLAEAVRGW